MKQIIKDKSFDNFDVVSSDVFVNCSFYGFSRGEAKQFVNCSFYDSSKSENIELVNCFLMIVIKNIKLNKLQPKMILILVGVLIQLKLIKTLPVRVINFMEVIIMYILIVLNKKMFCY